MSANTDRIVLGPIGDSACGKDVAENHNDGALARMWQDSHGSCKATVQLADAQPRVGVNQFWTDDLQENLMANVGQAVARANILAEPDNGKIQTMSQLRATHPMSNYWHADNRPINVADFMARDRKAVEQDLGTMCKGMITLDSAIKTISTTKQPLTAHQKDNLRQMAENGAMLTLALAQWQSHEDPLSARILISQGPGSVDNLLGIARANGANRKNLRQIQTLADRVIDNLPK